jgi:hypothetical protein
MCVLRSIELSVCDNAINDTFDKKAKLYFFYQFEC